MPASQRANINVSRATSSSRPYDRRSPIASPLQSESPPVSSQSLPPTSPIQDPELPPDHPGLPTYAEYKRIETAYLHSLSPRKRDKALITQAMFDKIWDVLHQPDACTIETPQFRFWVRKMFTLSRPASGQWAADGGTGTDLHTPDSDDDETSSLALERAMGIGLGASNDPPSAVVLHEHRPVAVVEQLYELFCYCHVRAGHGGRDKTCAVIRQHYSWVPKELTAQFVKACPTCASKRGGGGLGVGIGIGIGIGVDMGMTMGVHHGQVGHRRGRRGREAVPLGGEKTPGVPLSVGWPTTGGPLDPGNPEPCGVRERLRTREEARTVGPSSSPVSPASGPAATTHEVPLKSCFSGGWRDGLAVETTPFHLPLCDATHALGFSQLFSVDNPTAIVSPHRMNNQGSNGSPSKLPSLTAALSNESLDETLAPFVDGGERDATGEHLPSVLRPLRLLGPDATGPQPCLFQIDPMLLSFNYLGTELSGGLLSDSDVAFSEPDKGETVDLNASGTRMPPALSSSPEGQGHDATVRVGGMSISDVSRSPGLCPFRSPIMAIQSVIRMDSPDPLEVVDAYPDNVVQSLSTERPSNVPLSRSRCHGSRYGPPLAMLLPPCATDEVGQQLVMADA